MAASDAAARARLAKELGESPPPAESADGAADDNETKPRAKPKGRRDLRDIPMPEERIELLDVALEGKAERIAFQENRRLGYPLPSRRALRGAVMT